MTDPDCFSARPLPTAAATTRFEFGVTSRTRSGRATVPERSVIASIIDNLAATRDALWDATHGLATRGERLETLERRARELTRASEEMTVRAARMTAGRFRSAWLSLARSLTRCLYLCDDCGEDV